MACGLAFLSVRVTDLARLTALRIGYFVLVNLKLSPL